MAFFSKFGNILKQTENKQLNGQMLSALSSSSIFQAIRFMSSSKVFVGGISYSTDDQSLREAFSKYGEVVESRVIVDRETGRSRGFGFVTYTSTEEASSAIQALDGQDLHGRHIRVNYANDRSGGFRSSGFGGNYGPPGGGNWGGASGYGGGSDAGDNYVQGGDSGGYSQFSGDLGGSSQLGSNFGGNEFGGRSSQFGSNFGGDGDLLDDENDASDDTNVAKRA